MRRRGRLRAVTVLAVAASLAAPGCTMLANPPAQATPTTVPRGGTGVGASPGVAPGSDGSTSTTVPGTPSSTTLPGTPSSLGPESTTPAPEPVPLDPFKLADMIPPDSTPLCLAADRSFLAGTVIMNLGTVPGARSEVLTDAQQEEGLGLVSSFRQSSLALLGLLEAAAAISDPTELERAIADLADIDRTIDIRVTMGEFLEAHKERMDAVLATVPRLCPDGLLVKMASRL